MAQPIRITAEVQQHDPSTCKFVVDRPVFPKGFARFTSKDRAAGSSLPERLFAIDGVSGVMIQGQEVFVTKSAPVDWRATGPLVGAAIRAHLESGQPAVSEDALKTAPAEDRLREKVQRILDTQINPAIASHGGHIALIDVQGSTLYIKMGGGCQGCGQASATLRGGVESALRDQIPEISEILDITDHAEGRNPYYAPAH